MFTTGGVLDEVWDALGRIGTLHPQNTCRYRFPAILETKAIPQQLSQEDRFKTFRTGHHCAQSMLIQKHFKWDPAFHCPTTPIHVWNIYQHLSERNHPVMWVNIPYMDPWSIWVMCKLCIVMRFFRGAHHWCVHCPCLAPPCAVRWPSWRCATPKPSRTSYIYGWFPEMGHTPKMDAL